MKVFQGSARKGAKTNARPSRTTATRCPTAHFVHPRRRFGFSRRRISWFRGFDAHARQTGAGRSQTRELLRAAILYTHARSTNDLGYDMKYSIKPHSTTLEFAIL